MDLLSRSLEAVFKAADVNGKGTLDRAETETAFGAAFKESGTLSFSEKALEPILEELVELHGGRVNFEQFKEIAWKASVSSAPAPHIPTTPNVQTASTDRAGTFIV